MNLKALLAIGILAGCGGGGSSPTIPNGGPIIPASELRTDLLFGYFGDDPNTALEVEDHANLYFLGPWYDGNLLQAIQNLTFARSMGYKCAVISVPAYERADRKGGIDEVRFFLTRLQQTGNLVNVCALYPIDEPQQSESEVRAMNKALRGVMREFPELKDTKLAVIYDKGSWPAREGGARAELYDWIGMDNYDARCGVIEVMDRTFKPQLADDQFMLVVPGGADGLGNGSRQDPACFESYAHREKKVVAIISFMWPDNWNHNFLPGGDKGIRSNGMKVLFCQAGRKIKGNKTPC